MGGANVLAESVWCLLYRLSYPVARGGDRTRDLAIMITEVLGLAPPIPPLCVAASGEANVLEPSGFRAIPEGTQTTSQRLTEGKGLASPEAATHRDAGRTCERPSGVVQG